MSTPDDDDAEGFLSGWSRRKLAARREKVEVEDTFEQDETEAIDTEQAVLAEDALEDPEQEEVDDDFIARLPSIEDITEKTDLAPFMRRGVPLVLRNAALRKVWLLNPLIRDHVDPALDYAWDWNAPDGVPGGGGTLTGESVTQMVKKVLGDKNLVVDGEEPADETTALDADTDEVQSADLDAVPARAVRRSGPTDSEQPARESPDDASADGGDTGRGAEDRVNLPLTTTRRHGGALPE